MRRHGHSQDPNQIGISCPEKASLDAFPLDCPAADETTDEATNGEDGGHEAVSGRIKVEAERQAGRRWECWCETCEGGDGEVELGEMIAHWDVSDLRSPGSHDKMD